MARRIVDLSITLDNETIADPPFMRPTISYQDHAGTMAELQHFFPGITAEEMPGGQGFAASERITLTTHNGTHLDAPWHYHPTMNDGERASTIDEIPLDWCFRPGVKLDFRDRPDGHLLSAEDVADELSRIGHTLSPLEIVLANTGAGRMFGDPDFINSGCGFGAEATLYLTSRGIRVTGTDAWSWDAPFRNTAERVRKNGDTSLIWEGHKSGRHIGFCHLEKLANLDQLPPSGFMVSCFPCKIRGASAGWTRAVAIFDD